VVDSLLKVSTLTLPSLLAHAKMGPSSYGAHEIELTGSTKDSARIQRRIGEGEKVPLAECRLCSFWISQAPWDACLQTRTLPS
jgi:hypothetical protein